MRFDCVQLLTGACAGISLLVGNALAADMSASASVAVILPISVEEQTPMNFGTFASTSGSGSVRLNLGVSRFLNGTVDAVQGSFSGGRLNIVGEPNAVFDMSLVADIELSDGSGHTMSVHSFVNPLGGTLTESGTAIMPVGATLEIAANQFPGSYTGTYVVTILYN